MVYINTCILWHVFCFPCVHMTTSTLNQNTEFHIFFCHCTSSFQFLRKVGAWCVTVRYGSIMNYHTVSPPYFISYLIIIFHLLVNRRRNVLREFVMSSHFPLIVHSLHLIPR